MGFQRHIPSANARNVWECLQQNAAVQSLALTLKTVKFIGDFHSRIMENSGVIDDNSSESDTVYMYLKKKKTKANWST